MRMTVSEYLADIAKGSDGELLEDTRFYMHALTERSLEINALAQELDFAASDGGFNSDKLAADISSEGTECWSRAMQDRAARLRELAQEKED